jgi:hypothetical protein
MPSKSPAQHRLMEAVAHNPKFAKKASVPQSVGKEFAAADEGRKMGGSPKSKEEHMARRAKSVGQSATGGEFGVSQSTVSRKVRKQGFERMGGA